MYIFSNKQNEKNGQRIWITKQLFMKTLRQTGCDLILLTVLATYHTSIKPQTQQKLTKLHAFRAVEHTNKRQQSKDHVIFSSNSGYV